MPRTLVLDLLDIPDDDVRTALANVGPDVTWTRDANTAELLVASGRLSRTVLMVRTHPPDRVASLVANAARTTDLHVVLTQATPQGIRALLRLGATSLSAGHGAAEAAVRGVSLVEPLPARLQPTDPTPTELRVFGALRSVQLEPPALIADLPLWLPDGAEVEVIEGVAAALGHVRVTFRAGGQDDADGRPAVRLVPDAEVASRWDVLVAKVLESGGQDDGSSVAPRPWAPIAGLVASLPARWSGVDPDGFELRTPFDVREAAMVEVSASPTDVTATLGVFGRVASVTPGEDFLLRCERVPSGSAAAFNRRQRRPSATSVTAATRSVAAPVRGGSSVSAPMRTVKPSRAPAPAPPNPRLAELSWMLGAASAAAIVGFIVWMVLTYR